MSIEQVLKEKLADKEQELQELRRQTRTWRKQNPNANTIVSFAVGMAVMLALVFMAK